jgi:hypothetical protein
VVIAVLVGITPLQMLVTKPIEIKTILLGIAMSQNLKTRLDLTNEGGDWFQS